MRFGTRQCLLQVYSKYIQEYKIQIPRVIAVFWDIFYYFPFWYVITFNNFMILSENVMIFYTINFNYFII
jgi:hypothetical protein